MAIATIVVIVLAIAFGVERHAKETAEAKLEVVDRQLGAAQASLNQWHGAAESCSKATDDLAAKLKTTQVALDQVAAQKVRVVIQRETVGRALVAGADKSKSCEQAVKDFVAGFQPPAKLQTSAKPEVGP
jgi:hypothetical protein